MLEEPLINVQMATLTPAHEWLWHKSTYHVKVNRPTIMTNTIEGGFN